MITNTPEEIQYDFHNRPCYWVDEAEKEMLKFKIEDEKKKQRQKAGLKIHKSKKYKVYF